MQRVRRAVVTALALVLALGLTSGPAARGLFAPGAVAAADVAWPPSTLVVAELQTGGTSASDEFVEFANQGTGPVDLIGLEVVYATSSGSTVTRKATWTSSSILAPGRRVLVANSAGAFAGIGDAPYSGGFAATGGALALRVVGGDVIDAIGWGDATNTFVEGTVAPAPPAGSSLERRPGGALGNGIDTNDNAADWIVSSTPNPQGLASPPVPDPGPSPTPAPTLTPDPTTEPSPTTTPTSEPTPTAEPTPSIVPIATARSMPDGALITVAGVLTTGLGQLEAGRTAFIQDDSGGIALYLEASVVAPLPAGTAVIVVGTVDDRFAQRTLRAAEGDIRSTGTPGLPPATSISTGSAGEADEGRRLHVTGSLVAGPDILADGTAVTVDDGTGPLRVIITPDALAGRELGDGSQVIASGPLGQRDSSGTSVEGYRLFVTAGADLAIEAPATPSPVATPSPTPTTEPGPSSTPDPSPSTTLVPSASPSPSPSVPTIAAVRAMPVGSTVTVRGVVTIEAGRLGSPALLAIADGTGGIVVKLPAGVGAPARGRTVVATGKLADPYGQLEIRPAAGAFLTEGTGSLPAAVDLRSSGPGEATEGRLVRLTGVVMTRPAMSTSGDLSVTIQMAGGARVKVMADASSGLRRSALIPLARYRVTGISGQRASRKGAADGYRVWARDARDVVLVAAAPRSTPRASGSPRASGAAPRVISIAAATRTSGRDVAVEGVVTVSASLLDASRRRIVVQDATGAIEVLLPKDVAVPGIGARIRVTGSVGTAYGAPRLRATEVDRRGSAHVPAALRIVGPLTTAHTWRLVAVSGRVESVRKLGERWRAEIAVGAQRHVVVAQPGAHIPITALGEGGTAEVVGVVRPAHPSASDRRPNILPRSTRDVRRGAAGSGASAADGAAGGRSGPGTDPAATTPLAATALGGSTDADLVDLASLDGSVVRVGGLVVDLGPDGFTLDDGTATGRVILAGPAAEWIDLVEPGDAINVAGRVTAQPDGAFAVVVEDPAAIALGSALGGVDPAPTPEPLSPAVPDGGSSVRAAGIADGSVGLPGVGAGLGGLLAVSLLSLVATALRRRHARRMLAVRVAARLASIGGPAERVRHATDRSTMT